MSLINQMLRDLESRRTPEAPSQGVLPGSAPLRPHRNKSLLLLLLIVALLLLSAASGYLWLEYRKLQTAQPENSTRTADNAELASRPDTVSPSPPAPAAVVSPRVIVPHVTPETVQVPAPQVAQAPHLVAPTNSGKITANVARLHSISPSVLDGSWKPRSLTLRGEGLSNSLKVVVSWGSNEKILPSERVEWLDSHQARVKLVTGNSDEIWHIALQHPDGKRTRPLEFEVIASPLAQRSDSASLNIVGNQHMSKTIHPPSASEKAEKLYQQGYRALQQRQPKRAEQLWQQALSSDSMHSRSREGLIALMLSQSRKVEAKKLLEEGSERQPENTQFALLHARLLTEQGDTAAAIGIVEQAIAHSEQNPELYAFAAALYQQRNDFTSSVKSYQRALQLQPHNANWWMGVGISLEGSGKADEAKSAYQEALQRKGLNDSSRSYVTQRLQALK